LPKCLSYFSPEFLEDVSLFTHTKVFGGVHLSILFTSPSWRLSFVFALSYSLRWTKILCVSGDSQIPLLSLLLLLISFFFILLLFASPSKSKSTTTLLLETLRTRTKRSHSYSFSCTYLLQNLIYTNYRRSHSHCLPMLYPVTRDLIE